MASCSRRSSVSNADDPPQRRARLPEGEMTSNHTHDARFEDPTGATPVADLIGLDHPADGGDHNGEEGPTQYPLRVLIVDGDALVRRSWERAIRGEGLTVAGTGDRDAALMLVSSF